MKNSKIKNIITAAILFVCLFLVAPQCQATPTGDCADPKNLKQVLDCVAGDQGANFNITDVTRSSPFVVAGQMFGVALGLLGTVFLILMIYGGFKWMWSRGNEEEVTKAKDIIRNSIIGLAIVVGALAISVFVTYMIAGESLLNP